MPSIFAAIPLGTSAQLRIGPCTWKILTHGIEVECLAHGIVEFSIPSEIIKFMLAEGVEVVTGKRNEWGDEKLGKVGAHRWYDYQVWHLLVRSISDPQNTCRVVVECPLNTTLPILVTGLDFDEEV